MALSDWYSHAAMALLPGQRSVQPNSTQAAAAMAVGVSQRSGLLAGW